MLSRVSLVQHLPNMLVRNTNNALEHTQLFYTGAGHSMMLFSRGDSSRSMTAYNCL